MTLSRSLTSQERDRISARSAYLAKRLAERDPGAIRKTIGAMMLAIPSGRASGAEAEAIVGAYVHALRDMPPWAATEAANRFIRGEVDGHNAAFAPSAGEVYQVAKAAVTPLMSEARRYDAILAGKARDAEPPNEAVAEKLTTLRNELQTNIDEAEEERRKRLRPVLQKANEIGFKRLCEAHGIDPADGVSPELIASVKRMTGAPA